MKSFQIFLATFLLIVIMSFKTESPAPIVKTGIYGVCNCDDKSLSKVELTINEDFTFHYVDNFNPKKMIDLKGTWTLNENAILLKDYKSEFRIHDKWQIDNNEKCLKSRKGLEFTRLCYLKSCN